MNGKPATPDRRLAAIAAGQHGVLSIRQLRDAGVSDDAVRGRVCAGRLYRIHRGVYAVGHAGLSDEGRWMAAVLACSGDPAGDRGWDSGPGRDPGYEGRRAATDILERRGAALSHRSAAALWDLLPPASGPIDVSVIGDGGRDRRAGLRVHRSTTLGPEEIGARRGIPVTTPARTLADLRAASRKGRKGGVSAKELRRASRQAEYMGLQVGSDPETDRTRSELEAMFVRLCRRTGLTVPEVNVKIGPITVDFLWRDRHLVVETDGYRAHSGRQAFEDDRNRDLRLHSLGYEVVRLSYRQVEKEPDRIAATLRAILLSDGE